MREKIKMRIADDFSAIHFKDSAAKIHERRVSFIFLATKTQRHQGFLL
jgi:hypothetical protein